jgi:hypothetical protein
MGVQRGQSLERIKEERASRLPDASLSSRLPSFRQYHAEQTFRMLSDGLPVCRFILPVTADRQNVRKQTGVVWS